MTVEMRTVEMGFIMAGQGELRARLFMLKPPDLRIEANTMGMFLLHYPKENHWEQISADMDELYSRGESMWHAAVREMAAITEQCRLLFGSAMENPTDQNSVLTHNQNVKLCWTDDARAYDEYHGKLLEGTIE